MDTTRSVLYNKMKRSPSTSALTPPSWPLCPHDSMSSSRFNLTQATQALQASSRVSAHQAQFRVKSQEPSQQRFATSRTQQLSPSSLHRTFLANIKPFEGTGGHRARTVMGQRTGGGIVVISESTTPTIYFASAPFSIDLLSESTSLKPVRPRRAIGRIVSATSGVDRGRERLTAIYTTSTLQPPHQDRASRTRTARQALPSATLSSPTHLLPGDLGIGASDTTTRADWTVRREECDDGARQLALRDDHAHMKRVCLRPPAYSHSVRPHASFNVLATAALRSQYLPPQLRYD
ncbi:hypothetical protein C8F01DRAFT_1257633 [Mycena amicta]|nr:hypothetical protein C8F01DRAFT_1257633 [Mycena amicta]